MTPRLKEIHKVRGVLDTEVIRLKLGSAGIRCWFKDTYGIAETIICVEESDLERAKKILEIGEVE